MLSKLAVTILGFLFLVFAGVGAFFCRRYFARKTKGTSAGAAGAGLGSGKGAIGHSKALNDVIDWVFSHPHRGVEVWTDALARALTQQAAKNESPEDFNLRVEKISNFETAPRISNLSTHHSTSDKSLVVRADILWKRFELSLSLTPGRTNQGVLYSIDSRVIVFEFQSLVEGVLQTPDNVTVLTAKFPTEPKMRLEVKQNQEVDIDIAKLERLVRKIISDTDFRFLLSTQNRSSCFPSQQPERFELQNKTQSTLAANERLETLPNRTKKLLVRIIKASGLATSQERDYGTHQPFCVAFMDNPTQRYTTSSVKNTANPFFDEQFVFDLDQMTKKLTFEVHDKDRPENDDFLGMAFLTADDFSRNRHVLPLTGKGPMTFGALTVEVSIVDSDQVPSIMATSHNVQHITIPGSPIVLVSEADASNPLSMETPTGTGKDPAYGDSRTLPAVGALPPKGGDAKKKSLVGAIKKRFRRKKTDSRSQSADPSLERGSSSSSQAPQPLLGEGIYLTPTPSRASANIGYDELPVGSERRSRSNTLRKSLSRLFHLKRQEDSPTRLSGRGFDHSPEGSMGPPSPRLGSASPNRRASPQPTASGLTPTVSEQRLE